MPIPEGQYFFCAGFIYRNITEKIDVGEQPPMTTAIRPLSLTPVSRLTPRTAPAVRFGTDAPPPEAPPEKKEEAAPAVPVVAKSFANRFVLAFNVLVFGSAENFELKDEKDKESTEYKAYLDRYNQDFTWNPVTRLFRAVRLILTGQDKAGPAEEKPAEAKAA
jgi:hypothetical protein